MCLPCLSHWAGKFLFPFLCWRRSPTQLAFYQQNGISSALKDRKKGYLCTEYSWEIFFLATFIAVGSKMVGRNNKYLSQWFEGELLLIHTKKYTNVSTIASILGLKLKFTIISLLFKKKIKLDRKRTLMWLIKGPARLFISEDLSGVLLVKNSPCQLIRTSMFIISLKIKGEGPNLY